MFHLVYKNISQDDNYEIEYHYDDQLDNKLINLVKSNLKSMIQNYKIDSDLYPEFKLFGTIVNMSSDAYLLWCSYDDQINTVSSVRIIAKNKFKDNYKIHHLPININNTLFILSINSQFKKIFSNITINSGNLDNIKVNLSQQMERIPLPLLLHKINIQTETFHLFKHHTFNNKNISTLVKFIIRKIDKRLPKDMIGLIWDFMMH